MPSGGHAHSGPAPDPNALRRDRDKGDWTTLPAKREGPTPLWPLTRSTKREKTLWERAWTRPQAVMWERQRQEDEVANYVRQLVRSEDRDASAADRTLLMRMIESLGLSQPGLARNRWRIGNGAKPPSASSTRPHDAHLSVKERFGR